MNDREHRRYTGCYCIEVDVAVLFLKATHCRLGECILCESQVMQLCVLIFWGEQMERD